MMTVFEPLFLLLVLAALFTLGAAGVAALSGDRRRAVRILGRLGAGAAAYGVVVLTVAALSPQRIVHVREPQCWDDWCLTVTLARRAEHGDSVTWSVALRISSRAKRVTQRERGAGVYLTDARGRRFPPVPSAGEVPFDTAVAPGESVDAERRFELPRDATGVALVFAKSGFPIGDFIIGENELFRPAALVMLP